MKRIEVRKRGDQWVAERGTQTITTARTKTEAIKKTARVARNDPEDVSVRIHNLNGRIQEERTYPRKSDPRSSKG